MDIETINAQGIAPVQDLIDSVQGVDSFDALGEAIATLARESVDVPFGVSFYADLKASTINAVYLGQGGITMPNRDYYLDTGNDNFDRAREQLPEYISEDAGAGWHGRKRRRLRGRRRLRTGSGHCDGAMGFRCATAIRS